MGMPPVYPRMTISQKALRCLIGLKPACDFERLLAASGVKLTLIGVKVGKALLGQKEECTTTGPSKLQYWSGYGRDCFGNLAPSS